MVPTERFPLRAGGVVVAAALTVSSSEPAPAGWATVGDDRTTTPIKHVVVLFQENVPFDRYFGVYPRALNPPGEPRFDPAPGTPAVDGLTQALLTANPNAAAPHRLDRTQPNICGSNHGYTAEQRAVDQGRMDRFVQETGNHGPGCDPTLGMGYFDGNTVTALWTYAQHYAINDNSFGTTYGPSHLGVLNLVSGQTHGAVPSRPTGQRRGRHHDRQCGAGVRGLPSARPLTAAMTGRNIGDLLNDRHVTWGWFSDGFRPTSRRPDGTAVCDATATNRYGVTRLKYEGGDEGFQYYASTSNPHHLPPSSVAAIGRPDEANHQYDLADLWVAAEHGHLPAVSFVKAAGADQGGGPPSDPLDEQAFVVDFVNRLQQLPTWPDTAVIILYDDSDGSYDQSFRHSSTPRGRAPTHSRARAAAGPGATPGRVPRAVRIRTAPAVPRHLAVEPGQPRRPHQDRPDIGHPIHRGQLAARAHRRRLLRRPRRTTHRPVRLQPAPRSPLILDPATGLPLAGSDTAAVAPQGRRSGPGH